MNSAFLFMFFLQCTSLDCLSFPHFHRHFKPIEDKGFSVSESSQNVKFDQKVDHFSTDSNKTWKQEYYFHDNDIIRSDLALIIIGGEDDWMEHFASSCSNYSNMYQEGYCFGLEHRYYSIKGHKPSRNLKFLSSKQALADLSFFITEIVKKQYNVSKIVILGCSYPGSLAIWSRLKYPNLTVGAISQSAPLIAKSDFSEAFTRGFDVLNKAFLKECSENIIYSMYNWTKLNSSELNEFASHFDVCVSEKIDRRQLAMFLQSVPGNNILNYAQNGFDTDKAEVQSFCNINGSFQMAQFSANIGFGELVIGPPCFNQEQQCVNLTCAFDVIASQYELSVITSLGKYWEYQICTEFGWFRILPRIGSWHGAEILNDYYAFCMRVFGVNQTATESGINHTNEYYRGLNLAALTNTVIINGENDPWSELSVPQSAKLDPSVENHLISDGHHCPEPQEIIQNAFNRFFDL